MYYKEDYLHYFVCLAFLCHAGRFKTVIPEKIITESIGTV